MNRRPYATLNRDMDYYLLAGFGALCVFGFVMLTSASAPLGHAKFGDAYFFIKRQFLYGFVPGMTLFFLLLQVNYRRITRYAYGIFAACLLLLVAVFFPVIGSDLGTGAQSWIVLGNISFQPAELAKLLLILFLAGYLAKKEGRIGSFEQGFLPTVALSLAPIALVMLQTDLGTAAVMFAIVWAMLYAAGARLTHLLGLLLVCGGTFALLVASAAYRVDRLTTFLHPELDPKGIGYQINQAFMAIGSGGWWGAGFGKSLQKFQYLPEVHADSIFAIIAEETGFIATTLFVILWLMIALRALRLASRSPDAAGRCIVVGVLSWFIAQSFFNVGAMIGLLPLTGVPLPLVSHGGTALLATLAAVGVVLNVSKHTAV